MWLTLLETRFSGLYSRLPSADFTWVLNQLNLLEVAFSWCYFRFEPFWFYLRLHSVQTAFNLPDAAFQETFLLSQSSGHESDWEVSTKSGGDPSYIHTKFLPNQSKPLCTFDALLMHFWCTFDALLMHFWCTFKKFMNFWQKFMNFCQKFMNFLKVHQKCIKSASKVHQKCIKSASKVHQNFIKIASKAHQHITHSILVGKVCRTYIESSTVVHWLFLRLAWIQKNIIQSISKVSQIFFWLYSIDFPWVCTRYMLLGAAFNWLYKRLNQLSLSIYVYAQVKSYS